jgi:hypothetical protein
MRERKTTDIQIREKRLDISQCGLADGGIAHMTDRHRAGQAVDDRFLVEVIANKTETALRMKLSAVECYNTGCLLPPMLKGVKP